MENLPDDLVLDIIHRLFLKHAVRCSILNKRFYILVKKFEHENTVQSHTKICNHIYFLPWHLNVLHRLRLDPPYNPTQCETELSSKNFHDCSFTLLSSCAGLLLLKFEFDDNYCVFNPITEEYQFVPRDPLDSRVGLGVDNSGMYRLVAIQVKADEVKEKRVFKFRIFRVGLNMWEDAHEECLPYDWSFPDLSFYSDGSLHWLILYKTILSFDLEKCRARILHAPQGSGGYSWFGVVQGSLVYIKAAMYEIIIYVYDNTTSEWHVHHKIMHSGYCDVKFFNGERLIALPILDFCKEKIFMYDISSKSWRNIGVMRKSTSWKVKLEDEFIPFIPTTAKIHSGLYVNDKGSLDRSCVLMQTLGELVDVFRQELDI